MAALVVTWSVALIVALAVGVLVQGLRLSRTARFSSSVWSAVTLAPVIAATFSLLAMLTPNPYTAGCHCVSHTDDHPHLCWVHPASAEPLLIPALVCVGVWVLLTLHPLLRELVRIARTVQEGRKLAALRAVEVDGVRVKLADCGTPVAFTSGLLRPRIVADRKLWRRLSAQERRVLTHHEDGHADRRDPLTFALLSVLSALVPFGGDWVVRRWRLAAEIECDRRAAAELGSATDVAAALIKVARLQNENGHSDETFALSMASHDLRERVVSLVDRPAKASGNSNDVLSVAIVVAGLALLTVMWPGDAVHHAAETVLGWTVN